MTAKIDWKDPEQVRAYHRERGRRLRAENPEYLRGINRRWQAANRDRRHEIQRAYRERVAAAAPTVRNIARAAIRYVEAHGDDVLVMSVAMEVYLELQRLVREFTARADNDKAARREGAGRPIRSRTMTDSTAVERRTCEWCEGPLPARRGQRFCCREHKAAHQREEYATGDLIRELLADSTPYPVHRRATLLRDDTGRPIGKVCPCGVRFELERNSRGQITSRALCSRCRDDRDYGNPRPPAGLRKCVSCTAWEGSLYGSVPALDEAGLCPDCAGWARRREALENATRARERALAAQEAQAMAKLPLYTFGDYGAPETPWQRPVWPRSG